MVNPKSLLISKIHAGFSQRRCMRGSFEQPCQIDEKFCLHVCSESSFCKYCFGSSEYLLYSKRGLCIWGYLGSARNNQVILQTFTNDLLLIDW